MLVLSPGSVGQRLHHDSIDQQQSLRGTTELRPSFLQESTGETGATLQQRSVSQFSSKCMSKGDVIEVNPRVHTLCTRVHLSLDLLLRAQRFSNGGSSSSNSAHRHPLV